MPAPSVRCFSWLLVLGVALSLCQPAHAAARQKKQTQRSKSIAKKSQSSTQAKSMVGVKSSAVKSGKPKPADEPASVRVPKKSGASETPTSDGSLADYLRDQLGADKFHRRSEWAGHSTYYLPITYGRRVWKPIGQVKYLTIHISEGVPSEHPAHMIRNIFAGHTAASGHLGGAADVAYHFFVDTSGDVWEGRKADRLGTHVGSKPSGLNNEGNLGICGLGTYIHTDPPEAMTNSVVRLSRLIAQYYKRPLKMRGHKDWVGIHKFHPHGGCSCPGRLEKAVGMAQREITAAFEPKPDRVVAEAAKKPKGDKPPVVLTKAETEKDKSSGKKKSAKKPASKAR